MAQSKKTAGATKPAAKKAPASKPAATTTPTESTTPTPTPAAPVAPTTAESDAPDGVTTLEDVRGARLPESGPSDDSKAVSLVSPKGTKVRVEERTAKALRTQGYKSA